MCSEEIMSVVAGGNRKAVENKSVKTPLNVFSKQDVEVLVELSAKLQDYGCDQSLKVVHPSVSRSGYGVD